MGLGSGPGVGPWLGRRPAARREPELRRAVSRGSVGVGRRAWGSHGSGLRGVEGARGGGRSEGGRGQGGGKGRGRGQRRWRGRGRGARCPGDRRPGSGCSPGPRGLRLLAGVSDHGASFTRTHLPRASRAAGDGAGCPGVDPSPAPGATMWRRPWGSAAARSTDVSPPPAPGSPGSGRAAPGVEPSGDAPVGEAPVGGALSGVAPGVEGALGLAAPARSRPPGAPPRGRLSGPSAGASPAKGVAPPADCGGREAVRAR